MTPRTFQASIDGARFTLEPNTWSGSRHSGTMTYQVGLVIEVNDAGEVVGIYDAYAAQPGVTIKDGKKTRPTRQNLIESHAPTAGVQGRLRTW